MKASSRGASGRFGLPSRGEIWDAVVFAAVPVHLWTYLQFFYQTPALVLRFTILDTLGVLAYVLAAALLDVVTFIGGLALLAVLLPPRFLRDQFAPAAVLITIWTSIWAAAFHYANVIAIRLGGGSDLALVVTLGILVFLYFAVALPLPKAGVNPRVQRGALSLIERASFLGLIFLAFDVVSLLVIAARNLI